jgi:hypothetical protein
VKFDFGRDVEVPLSPCPTCGHDAGACIQIINWPNHPNIRSKRTFEAEQDAEYVRRAQDTVELMRAELRRRAVECCVEDEAEVQT